MKLIFQFTSDEITDDIQQKLFEPEGFDKGNIKSFLFCAVELKDNTYARTKYAEFTREINKPDIYQSYHGGSHTQEIVGIAK